MSAKCSRSWQAEATLDGRLSRADAESFEHHAATCSVCAREVRAFETLYAVGQRLPVLTSTPLEHRRLRQSVLLAANEVALSPRRSRHKHRIALGAVAVAALVLLVFGLRTLPDSTPAVAVGVPAFHLETSEGAAWSSRSRETTARLLLKSGWFELSVDKLKGGQRFILELPDGELEVKGTRFTVKVRDAKTTSVRVHEGRVALRLRGHRALLLEAGDSWPGVTAKVAASVVEHSAHVPRAEHSSHGPSAAPDMSAPSAVSTRVGASDTAVAPALPSPASGGTSRAAAHKSDEAPRPGDDFAQAMSAFSAGDFGKAERLLSAFERAHPADARVEDATFLRAVARARRGDSATARTMAREYLRRYPNGLRRAEAERLAR